MIEKFYWTSLHAKREALKYHVHTHSSTAIPKRLVIFYNKQLNVDPIYGDKWSNKDHVQNHSCRTAITIQSQPRPDCCQGPCASHTHHEACQSHQKLLRCACCSNTYMFDDKYQVPDVKQKVSANDRRQVYHQVCRLLPCASRHTRLPAATRPRILHASPLPALAH